MSKIEAFQTANKQYNYDDIIFNKKISEWIQDAHKYNCKINNWKYMPLKKGAFGFDNLVVSLMKVFDNILKNKEIINNDIEICKLIHIGWQENYLFWRDNNPHYINFSNQKYIKPSKTLGDERRNKCAITEYENLPEDEKNKDIVFAKYIKQNINI